jgi:hypothetical protein
MNNDADEYGSFFWWMNVVANYCQIESYNMNKEQLSNLDIMKHLQEQDRVLQNQDKMLEEQTNKYLIQILENQKEILKLLKGGKTSA